MTGPEQGSAEWLAQRLGKATASRISDIVAKTKTGWGASRHNYAAQLIAERLTGRLAESYTNAAMQRGTEVEPLARDAYSFMTDLDVEQVGFIQHPTIAMSGASPDGLVGTDGLVEIKCPNTATHIDTLLGAEIDKGYRLQMQWQMACTGRRWCDFVSFDDRLPPKLRIFIRRCERDDALIAQLESEVQAFLREIDTKVAALESNYGALQQEAA